MGTRRSLRHENPTIGPTQPRHQVQRKPQQSYLPLSGLPVPKVTSSTRMCKLTAMNPMSSEANDESETSELGSLPALSDDMAGSPAPAEASEHLTEPAHESSTADIDLNETGGHQPRRPMLAADAPEPESDGADRAQDNGDAAAMDGTSADAAKTRELAASEENADADSPVAASLSRIELRLDELTRLSARQADHVGSLHSENQRLRGGELNAALLPLMRDVIRAHDDVVRLASSCDPSARHDLQLVKNLMLETLARWDITAFEPEAGESFNTAAHSGMSRIETDEGIANTVASVRRCGFRDGTQRVIRTAEVDVYVPKIARVSNEELTAEGAGK